MVRMGTVWDRTTEVLSGRGGALARIAAAGVFLPSVVRAGFAAYAGGPAGTPAVVMAGALVSLVGVVILIWAQLALIALSSDPATTPAAASSLATRRVGPAVGIFLALGLVFAVLLIPAIAVLAGSGIDFSPALMQAGIMPAIPPGVALFLALYLLAFAIAALVLAARLALVNAVVVNERLGLGAVRRSFALTRGSAWRIIGVLILYAIVLFVATLAAQSIVGVAFGLILGRGVSAAFLAAVAAAAVGAALTTVAAVFAAQLYVATRAAAGASSGT